MILQKDALYKQLLVNELLDPEEEDQLNNRIVRSTNRRYRAMLANSSLKIKNDTHIRISLYLLMTYSDKHIRKILHDHGHLSIDVFSVKIAQSHTIFSFNKKKIELLKLTIEAPISPLAEKGPHHQVSITYDFSVNKSKQIGYSLISRIARGNKLIGKSKKIINTTDNKISIFLRQSTKNYLYITLREKNITDSAKEKRKINSAWILSKIISIFWKPVIFYEKHTSSFEESAARLFSVLAGQDTKNIYFILPSSSETFTNIKKKYKNSIIEKYTFKHYLAFFCANSFIATESLAHSVDLRPQNKRILRRIVFYKGKFIFLQHGVMYMVSLSSATRRGFRYRGGLLPANSKVVVSSLLEAKHFILQGNYPSNKLLLTGLPKFDVATKDKDADKIVIMPTWRPWELNLSKIAPESTGYYKMIKSIVSAVPKEFSSKIIILPHPLFKEVLDKSPLAGYCIDDSISYDDVLKKTDLLITDYSSIAYDAFYRGANVIFWWKNKEECMAEYRGGLMLNDSNIFGDIARNKTSLKKSILKAYKKPQKNNYLVNFRRLVNFNDNGNTERLIEQLKNDKII
jgi:hypothetical protein